MDMESEKKEACGKCGEAHGFKCAGCGSEAEGTAAECCGMPREERCCGCSEAKSKCACNT